MRKIWLALVAIALTAPWFATVPAARADSPAMALSADDRILGKADAPITIIEYASLTCPHCAEFDRDTLPKVKAAWIESGKAKLVFRDFPLDGLALRAAMLARCAPPERFYGFIDTLFQSQLTWARAHDPIEALGRIAKLGGMTEEQFQSCMKNEEVSNNVVASENTAQKELGVNSTPTFFVNGIKVEGAVNFEAFGNVLDKALAVATPKT
ncbi:MAG TPA: thioredoxin domain-containing protein [Stellaceae bacterium]|nr:thioredoxin domain-containing protein [Stellaceae bacterium]